MPVATVSLAGDQGLGEGSRAEGEYTQAREDPRRGSGSRSDPVEGYRLVTPRKNPWNSGRPVGP